MKARNKTRKGASNRPASNPMDRERQIIRDCLSIVAAYSAQTRTLRANPDGNWTNANAVLDPSMKEAADAFRRVVASQAHTLPALLAKARIAPHIAMDSDVGVMHDDVADYAASLARDVTKLLEKWDREKPLVAAART